MEGSKLGRRWLLTIEPTLRSVHLCVRAPQGRLSAHGVVAPANTLTLVDADASRQHIVFNARLDVFGHDRVKAQGLIETGLGVTLLLGAFVGWESALEDIISLLAKVRCNIGVAASAMHQVEGPANIHTQKNTQISKNNQSHKVNKTRRRKSVALFFSPPHTSKPGLWYLFQRR